jgi:hypothetical protein
LLLPLVFEDPILQKHHLNLFWNQCFMFVLLIQIQFIIKLDPILILHLG